MDIDAYRAIAECGGQAKPAPKVKGPRKRLRSRSHRKVAPRSPLKPQRLADPAAIEAAKKPYCEICGKPSRGIDPHHVITQGAGGPDMDENLIQPCWDCHYVKIPSGKLTRRFLFAIIAKRKGLTVEEVERRVYVAKV